MAALALTACSEPDETQALLSALKAKADSTPIAEPVESGATVDINPRLLHRFRPLHTQLETPKNSLTDAKVDLGRALFFEPRLSKNQDISCNTCHKLDAYGVDGLPTSLGHRNQHGTRNAPTVYNAAGFFAQFWDGRMDTVEQQALGPISNPVEMALPSEQQGIRVLKSIPQYQEWFKQAFPEEQNPVTLANVGRAIGAFERRLTTPARWDDYLRGNQAALDKRELEGLKLFTNIGCMVCHTGEFVGGAMYQKVGIVEAWPNQKDQGRFEVTKQETDRMMFKVPTLRNITKTAPYFHDGSVATLNEAVLRMAKYQLGLTLAEFEVDEIVAWLGSLTGELPAAYIKPPALPPSTEETPLPDPK
jgi:cytochrome c peroxidase